MTFNISDFRRILLPSIISRGSKKTAQSFCQGRRGDSSGEIPKVDLKTEMLSDDPLAIGLCATYVAPA